MVGTYTVVIDGGLEKTIRVLGAATRTVVLGTDIQEVPSDVREDAAIGHPQRAGIAVVVGLTWGNLVGLSLVERKTSVSKWVTITR